MSDLISRQRAIDKFIDDLEEIFSDIRERHVDDSVCGLCEYDGAYMGQSGDWCNECPGFDRDDCFKLSDKTRKKWTDKIIKVLPSAEPDTTTHDSIPVETGKNDGDGTSGDCISRQAMLDGIDELIKIHFDRTVVLYKARQVAENLPSVQPERPTGEWIQKPRYEDDEYPDVQPDLKCPFCGYEIGWCDMGNYCARCGADLKGGAE